MNLLALSVAQLLVGLVFVGTVVLVAVIVGPPVARWNAVRRARAHAYRNGYRYVSDRLT